MMLALKEQDLRNRILTLKECSNGLQKHYMNELYTSFYNYKEMVIDEIEKLKIKITQLEKELIFKDIPNENN